MEQISQETVALILSEKFDENFWFFELGRSTSIIESNTSVENQFMNSFLDKGEQLWEQFKNRLKDVVCDKETKSVNKKFDELVLGNVREVVVVLLMELTKTHNFETAVAIPLVAILIKQKLQTFCSL